MSPMVLVELVVAPRLRATGLPCIASPETMSSGNTQHLGIENNHFIDTSGSKFTLQQVVRPSGTHGAAEQYVHYLVNIKGPRSRQLRGSGTTTKRNSIAQGHRCGHDLDSDITPFQRDFPESWHDTPGQYIECTCKLTTSINIMTSNIMILSILSSMQEHTRDAVNMISCLKSLGLAYQTGYLITKRWSFSDHKRTNTLVFIVNKQNQHVGSHPQHSFPTIIFPIVQCDKH